jgi:hypothetical protein
LRPGQNPKQNLAYPPKLNLDVVARPRTKRVQAVPLPKVDWLHERSVFPPELGVGGEKTHKEKGISRGASPHAAETTSTAEKRRAGGAHIGWRPMTSRPSNLNMVQDHPPLPSPRTTSLPRMSIPPLAQAHSSRYTEPHVASKGPSISRTAPYSTLVPVLHHDHTVP